MNSLETKSPLVRDVYALHENNFFAEPSLASCVLKNKICLIGHKALIVTTVLSSLLFLVSNTTATVLMPSIMIAALFLDLKLIKHRRYEMSIQLNAILMTFIGIFFTLIVPCTVLESFILLSAMILMVFQKQQQLTGKTIFIISSMILSVVVIKILFPVKFYIDIENWQATIFHIGTIGVVLGIIFLTIRVYQNHSKTVEHEAFNEKNQILKSTEKEMEARNNELSIQNQELENQLSLKQNDIESINANVLVQMKNKEKVLQQLEGLTGKSEVKKELQKIIIELRSQLDTDKKLHTLQGNIKDVNAEFSVRLIEQYPVLTKNDRELCAYMKLGMSSKEIAQLRNTTANAINVAKSRLRKKMGLSHNKEIAERLYQL
ncbi:hypothetical protein [Flammeovirga sp. EKP202]|uniref:helix-turn-helix transcriptional regulator n=1 Tax=Flammeovirga sp. EKP202 TaxID=2770592 RepID=UPI00165F0F8F|nr:hypothetical protein [Flammeovirga sp. EKP202]MBD0401283.1 hypothetical protein [Flammeovirga sp. EKP202]